MSEIESGATDIEQLVSCMEPELLPGDFVFLSFESSAYGDHADLNPIACFKEQEGLTLVVPKSAADQSGHTYTSVFNCITLQIHSSLDAVGLTAAFATQLTRYGISANVIAGFYHDHIFVGVDDALKAVEVLQELAAGV